MTREPLRDIRMLDSSDVSPMRQSNAAQVAGGRAPQGVDSQSRRSGRAP